MKISTIIHRHRELIIDLAYIAILGRKADASGKQTYIHNLLNNSDLKCIISDLLSSDEYKTRSSSFRFKESFSICNFINNNGNTSSPELTTHAQRIFTDLNNAVYLKTKPTTCEL